MPYLGIFRLTSWKTIVTLEMSTLKYVNFQNFVKKTKFPLFDTKNALFGYFCARILKNCCNISSKHTQIYLILKCSKKKQEDLNLGPKLPWLDIFIFVLEVLKLFNILNQHPHICLIAKFCKKKRLPKFRTLNGFAYFGGKISKKTYHIWNLHTKICLIGKFCKKKKYLYIWETIFLISVFLG